MVNQKIVNYDTVGITIKSKASLGLKKLNDFKKKVSIGPIEIKLNESDDIRLKDVHGGWVLNKEHMGYLRTHQYVYNASAGSVLEVMFLQRFWIWLSGFVPLYIAPCVITGLGLAINVITTLFIVYYSSDARGEAPSWTFALCAFGVFLYQTFDALDGKQSYKVQNTPIEEMYDHGCDAVSTIFVTLAVSCAIQMGRTPALHFAFFVFTMIAFFSTHWLCHVTHQMIFGKIDVSECQWLMITIHVLTSIYGQKIWNYRWTIIGIPIEICHVFSLLSIIALFGAIVLNIRMILGRPTPLDRYVTIPRKTSNIWQPLWSCSILTFFTFASYLCGYFYVSPLFFVLSFGFAFAKITMKLVMMNCCHGDMEIWDSSLIAPILLVANAISLLHPKTALICAFIYSLMDFARYFTYSSWDMRVALDSYIFTIKYPIGHPKNRRDSGGYYVNGLNNDKVLNLTKVNQNAQ